MKQKNLKKVALTSVAISFIATIAFAGENTKFDLQVSGKSVCKTSYINDEKVEGQKPCYDILLDLPGKIEVVDQVSALLEFKDSKADTMPFETFQKIGGAIVLNQQKLEDISKNYRRISIRNFAVNSKSIIEKNGDQLIPFYADVYWKGRALMEGTLHTEGYIVAPKDEVFFNEDSKENTATTANFTNFSDSTTEQKKDSLRFIETSARHIHFTIVNGFKTNVDEDTITLLNNVVGPVMIGEYFHVPLYVTFIKQIPKIFGEGIKSSAENIMNNLELEANDSVDGNQLP